MRIWKHARVTAVASPRSARTGRDAYAGQLGRTLARHGVVVREAAALRRAYEGTEWAAFARNDTVSQATVGPLAIANDRQDA